MTPPESADEVDLDIPGLVGAQRIGSGGFGTVYAAEQTDFGRRVAVKMLSEKLLDERVRTRFRRECLALGRLSSHPNIITVFGGGFTPHDRPYLLMEFMSRGSLADRQAEAGRVEWSEVTTLVTKCAGALETAHRAGVLHRDIKPENILLSRYGEPMLADFGIARLNDSPATQTTAITTSVAHAAPEIFEGNDPTAAWDVYALGSTMFTVLAGRYAFVRTTDESVLATIARIATAPVPDLRAEGVPAPVCEVIETAMAKEPADRYATAIEMGRALQAAQRRLGLHPTPLTVEGEPALPPPPAAPAASPPAAPAPAAPPPAAPPPAAPSPAAPSVPPPAPPRPRPQWPSAPVPMPGAGVGAGSSTGPTPPPPTPTGPTPTGPTPTGPTPMPFAPPPAPRPPASNRHQDIAIAALVVVLVLLLLVVAL